MFGNLSTLNLRWRSICLHTPWSGLQWGPSMQVSDSGSTLYCQWFHQNNHRKEWSWMAINWYVLTGNLL